MTSLWGRVTSASVLDQVETASVAFYKLTAGFLFAWAGVHPSMTVNYDANDSFLP